MPQRLNVQELAQKLSESSSIHLVDVRQEWEHQTASLPNSQLIPLDQLMVRAKEIDADADALIVAYCHHGIRSQSAAALLEHLGFANVATLDGGIDAWSEQIDPSVPRY